ncbi:MAG: tRNA 2-selenouridine(34) synthase MnmH [Alphaproteobacteria bacterium]|nr:tRNA 2-selenouridine(34) synthase MnmH [Alphaproteobacteria bacterium]
MAFELTELSQLDALAFDRIIDVRSPAEFAQDHLPGAINLAVLDDEERARIGTIYVQDSRFRARKLGAALVARNAAHHLENTLVDEGGGFRPLVYCWRGGQRSGSFATILAQIGWRVQVLDGGYRSYRRLVVRRVYDDVFPAPVMVLGGNTGTAKTEILARLKAAGAQVIDLEGLANHRGSLFGARAGGQPSQKAFEGALAMEIARLDPARPVMVEAESSKVGQLYVPPSLWKAMRAAPRIFLDVPLAERARYLTKAYGDLVEDRWALAAIINRLRPLHPAERIEHWLELAQQGAFEALASELMQHHYDPRYSKQNGPDTEAAKVLHLDDLSDASLDRAAATLSGLMATPCPAQPDRP